VLVLELVAVLASAPCGRLIDVSFQLEGTDINSERLIDTRAIATTCGRRDTSLETLFISTAARSLSM